MKKKTVITTEKREVWVVRDAIPEPDQSIEGEAIEVHSTENASQEPDELEGSKTVDR
jgi:hypothetical protein